MDIDKLIEDLRAKIGQVIIERDKMIERVTGESNGRVDELQGMINLLKEQKALAIAAAGPVVPDAQDTALIEAPAA